MGTTIGVPYGFLDDTLTVVAQFIGRWKWCSATMNCRVYHDYSNIAVAQPTMNIARLFLVFPLSV